MCDETIGHIGGFGSLALEGDILALVEILVEIVNIGGT